MNSDHQSNKLLILVGSPRRDGNSAALAEAARHGAETAGIAAELLFLDDYIKHFLTDLRHAPAPDDGYDELFLRHFLPARGVLFCTPSTGTACRRRPRRSSTARSATTRVQATARRT